MQANELFMGVKLPKPLTWEELYSCFEKMKSGDTHARDKIIRHNIRLVMYQVQKFSDIHELDELVSIGVIGLIRAVDTFDIDKGIKFSTYAVRCIDNEILMFLRKRKKYSYDVSLDQPITVDQKGNALKVEDILDTNSDFAVEYEKNELYKIIREVVNQLPEKDKNIIIKYFGFIDNNPMSQSQLAKELGLSQTNVSRIIKRILKDISIRLKHIGIIDVFFKQKNTTEKNTIQGVIKMPTKLYTIYEHFNRYTKKQIDEMLSKLTDEERLLITLRYGNDLENPVTSKEWNQEKADQYYRYLWPKMKKLLANPDYIYKPRKSKAKKKVVSLNEMQLVNTEQTTMNKSQLQHSNIEDTSKLGTKENGENPPVKKEDYIKILELLKKANFGQMLNVLTPKEAIIVCLRLGY